jgi:hypothetical protein
MLYFTAMAVFKEIQQNIEVLATMPDFVDWAHFMLFTGR